MNGKVPSGFDVEFGDPLRKRDVPAITQKFLLQRGLEYLRKDFGVTPLFLMGGGGAWSRSYPHHSARIAAELGFGLSHLGGLQQYLGKDLVIASLAPIVRRGGWAHNQKLPGSDVPWTIDSPYWLVFHDRDVSLDITAVERLLASLASDVRYVSASEYTGYLHAQVEREDRPDQPASLAVFYDDHYCQYFASHESRWTLHLSDEMRRDLKTTDPEKRTITIPKGLGRHTVCLGPAAH
jgi:hypothetical protein